MKRKFGIGDVIYSPLHKWAVYIVTRIHNDCLKVRSSSKEFSGYIEFDDEESFERYSHIGTADNINNDLSV